MATLEAGSAIHPGALKIKQFIAQWAELMPTVGAHRKRIEGGGTSRESLPWSVYALSCCGQESSCRIGLLTLSQNHRCRATRITREDRTRTYRRCQQSSSGARRFETKAQGRRESIGKMKPDSRRQGAARLFLRFLVNASRTFASRASGSSALGNRSSASSSTGVVPCG